MEWKDVGMEIKPTVLDLLFKIRASHSLSKSASLMPPLVREPQAALGVFLPSEVDSSATVLGSSKLYSTPASPPCCDHAGKRKRYLEDDEGQKEEVQEENKGGCDWEHGESGLRDWGRRGFSRGAGGSSCWGFGSLTFFPPLPPSPPSVRMAVSPGTSIAAQSLQ